MPPETLAIPPLALVDELIRAALAEDVGPGDLTSTATIPAGTRATAVLVAREGGMLAGLPVAERVFETVDPRTSFEPRIRDGQRFEKGATLALIEGEARSLLTAERLALNFLQHLSGIATETARLVALLDGLPTRLIDTRKTVPGLRALAKYAVRAGGGHNHRLGLYDAVLIKDNHIAVAGGIRPAVERARALAPHTSRVEVEADTLDQVREALDAGADVVLLDNMAPEKLRDAVDLCRGRALTEASGGITAETVRAVAETGVDLISVGALTHSVRAVDIALDIQV